jgi:hypothetical protein
VAKRVQWEVTNRRVGKKLTERARFLKLRNQLYGALKERMATVKSAARFVFRSQPDRLDLFFSSYERRKRARRAGGARVLAEVEGD